MATTRVSEVQLSDPAAPLNVASLTSDATGNVNVTPRGSGKLTSPTAQFTSAQVLNAPSAATDAANKQYVDLLAAGFTFKQACQAASTANLSATYNNGAAGISATLTNSGALAAFAVDGYTASTNDRILVKDQTTAANNGIYLVTTVGSGTVAWILTRATDYDSPSEIVPGSFIGVINGTANAGSFWVETSTVATVGTDPITFASFGTAISYPLGVNLGGTGASTLTNHGVMIGQGTSAVTAVTAGGTGQILRSPGVGSNPAFTVMSYLNACTPNTLFGCTTSNTMTAIGPATNSVLVTNGTGTGVPSLSQTLPTAVQGNITSTGTISSGIWAGTAISAIHGGSGQTSYTKGDLLAASSSTVLSKLAIGTDGFTLQADSTQVTGMKWASPTTVWNDVSGAFSPINNNGYFATATANGTLPSSPSQGDSIKFCVKHASQFLTITASGTQVIRLGSIATATGGTAVSTLQGDSINLTYSSSDNTWYAIGGAIGTWILT